MTYIKSNKEKVIHVVEKHPGLRFHEIKEQCGLANGTVQHHLSHLAKMKTFTVKYDRKVPRYYSYDIEGESQTILLRLRQTTTSKIIKSLLQNGCQSFSQLVKSSQKSAGTVSIYKNMLLQDKIIIGDTEECSSCPEMVNKIKYKLVNPDAVNTLIQEYGKTSLKKSSDNLADIFLSIK